MYIIALSCFLTYFYFAGKGTETLIIFIAQPVSIFRAKLWELVVKYETNVF